MESTTISEMTKQIFLDENFPESSAMSNESFDEEEFKDRDEVVENLNRFWSLSNQKQRKYVRNMPLVLERVGPENLKVIATNLYKADRYLLESNHEVALLLIDTIPLLSKTIENNVSLTADENALCDLEDTFLDFLRELIESSEHKLLIASRKTLVAISKTLSKRTCDNKLLAIVLTLLHDPQSELNRLSALELIKQLHSFFSKQYIEGFIATDILALMQDNNSRVKTEAYKTFFALFSAFEGEFVEKRFLDVIENMSNDSNVDLKMIFIKNVPLISTKLAFKKFEFKILPKYMDHLAAKNRFVKEEALLIIGELICSLISSSDSAGMLEVYHSQIFDKIFENYFDLPRLTMKMNLPVLKAIVRANFPLLKKVLTMKKNGLWLKIKRLILTTEEMDSAVIELAKLEIAGQLDIVAQVTDKMTLEKELIHLIDKYYLTIGPSTTEKIKQATIKVLAGVLKELNPEIREQFADVYHTTMNQDMRKWRLRFVISEQIENLSKLFTETTVVSKILPMYFSFCQDNCAVVRKNASKYFWKLLRNLEDEDARRIALVSMKSFGRYNRFVLRQSFILMLGGVLIHLPECVDEEMVETLKELAADRVINIRIGVAQLFAKLKTAGSKFEWEDQILNLLVENIDSDLYKNLKGIISENGGEALQNKLEENMQKMLEERKTKREGEKAFVSELRRNKGIVNNKISVS